MTDPIADLLTRIRNALQARHSVVSVPASHMKEAVLKILKAEGFISNYVIEEKKPQSEIKIFLRYDENKKPEIRQIRRISKPGGRIYTGFREIRPHLKGLGVRILSTPQGVLTDKEARKAKVGGEVLCEIS